MNSVTVSGHSDDVIVVEGEEYSDEFYATTGPKYIHFTDGTVLRVIYTDGGVWKIQIEKTGAASVTIIPATDETTNYTDRATVTGDFDPRKTRAWGCRDGPQLEDAVEALSSRLSDEYKLRQLGLSKLRRIIEIVEE